MPSKQLFAELRDSDPHKDDQNVLTFQHGGYLIFVGRNAFSNERLIVDHPHRDCLWLHAMAARGSHLVLCIHERPDPNEEVLQYAGRLALRNSHSEARTVSIGFLKDCYKPEDGGPGVWKIRRSSPLEVL